MRLSSLAELTGDDDSATSPSTVTVIRMPLKEYAWPSHIPSKQERMDQPRVGEVANPTRGQLNEEFKYFTVCLVRA